MLLNLVIEELKGGQIVNRALRIVCSIMVALFLLGGIASADGVNATSTTSNALGVLIDGTNVSLFVPYTTNNSLKMGNVLKIIESAPGSPTPRTIRLKTGYANSCAASPATGIALCSAVFGSSYAIRPPNNAVTGFKSGVKKRIHFTGGSCANCGVAMDDDLGLAIIATSKGYLPVQLSPLRLQTIISTNGEAISGQFGYDPIDHIILSPNYQLLNIRHFQSGPPHYQLIDVANGSAFDLSDSSDFFNAKGNCTTNTGGSTQRDALPDSGAYDTVTGIAYGTFRSPADCEGENAVEDIALFDLRQASFDTDAGTWSTPGKQVQTLTEMSKLSNGITGIAIVPGQSLAILADRREHSGGGSGFGALRLPTTSGSGIPSIQDWVQADMPNDPTGKPWKMSYMPNGLTAYASPNNGRGMGVIVNRRRTFAAVVDIEALLDASRQGGTTHTISSTVDLVGEGIVRFVDIRPGK